MSAVIGGPAQELVAVRFDRGAGLGTRLFPWARAVLYARDHGRPMIAPFWPRWTTSGLVRGGIAYRNFLHQISLVGAFCDGPDQIRGWRKLRAIVGLPQVSESAKATDPGEGWVRAFSGPGDMFRGLNGRNRELLARFEEIIRPRWLAVAARHQDFVIGVNIRRGSDFKDAADHRGGPVRSPLGFFIDSLRYVRSVVGAATPALVVSDGTPHDLRDVLAEGAITLLRPGCASSDLYALAQSKVLIGSGGSSFSAWASFFARCPTITIPGHSLRWFELDHGDSVFVGEFEAEQPSPLFRRNLVDLRRRLDLNPTPWRETPLG